MVSECLARGIPVFNAPGANANAVSKSSGRRRHADWPRATSTMRCPDLAIDRWTRTTPELEKRLVEAGKRLAFAGYELARHIARHCRWSRQRSVCLVADAAIKLGMHVTSGYDPDIAVESAMGACRRRSRKAHSLGEVLKHSNFLTLRMCPRRRPARGMIDAAAALPR